MLLVIEHLIKTCIYSNNWQIHVWGQTNNSHKEICMGYQITAMTVQLLVCYLWASGVFYIWNEEPWLFLWGENCFSYNLNVTHLTNYFWNKSLSCLLIIYYLFMKAEDRLCPFCLSVWVSSSFSSVQSLSRVPFFVTPWIAALQASLSSSLELHYSDFFKL